MAAYALGGPDNINGGPGNDTLREDEGNDVLYSEEGNDNLRGGAGDDVLRGGPGADCMFGSQHLGAAERNDRFAFAAVDEMNGDTISGLKEGNTLDFCPMQLVFRGTGAFEATGQAQLRYEADTSPEALWRQKGVAINTVQIDGNGDRLADEQMKVTHNFLSGASFLI